MALANHVDVDELIRKSVDHPSKKHLPRGYGHNVIDGGSFGSRFIEEVIPKYEIPARGISVDAAYQLIHDEVELDGAPLLNLASFVSTWMPDRGTQLYTENMFKNLADQDEYPSTVNIQTRCVSILAKLWKLPKDCKAIGTATGGSSEAIMLGGLAMKKRWQARRKEQDKDPHHPNIVFGSNAQVALEKFARYFDVECRLVPVDESTGYGMSPDRAMEFIDENTIGVIVILGSTYTGMFEGVKRMSDLLDEYEAKTGISVPIHVDAASGGFVAPFAYPDYEWAFSVSRVNSINTSGHKFGLVPVGLGWVVWKDESLLPKELIFELHYLGSTEYSFNLNFSRPAAPVLSQMFNFLNLGFDGYRKIVLSDLANARLLSRALINSGYYEVVSQIHLPAETSVLGALSQATKKSHPFDEDDPRKYVPGLPVVAFRFSQNIRENYPHIKQRWIQDLLRQKQWIVPNYNLPPKVDDIEILRVVVRESFSRELLERLLDDIITITEKLLQGQGSEYGMMAAISGDPGPRDQVVFSKPC